MYEEQPLDDTGSLAADGYANPGYTDPGYTDPGYTDPGYTDPGYTDPPEAVNQHQYELKVFYDNPGYTDPPEAVNQHQYGFEAFGKPQSLEDKEVDDSGNQRSKTFIEMDDPAPRAQNGGEGAANLNLFSDIKVVMDAMHRHVKDGTEDLNSMFFPDSHDSLRVDYVLAYDDIVDHKKIRKREEFQARLQKKGLKLQIEDRENSVDNKTDYVLVHAPWEVLMKGAEMVNMKKAIKMPVNLHNEVNQRKCCDCSSAFQPPQDIVADGDEYFTAPFSSARMDMFDIDHENTDSFFTNAERSLIVKEVLDRTMYTTDENDKKFGISSLVRNGSYIAAYPLHERSYKLAEEGPAPYDGDDKDRLRLYEGWAKPKRFMYYQPLDLIREYFGERVAIYFAWLGFYTQMLIPAALLGVGAIIYAAVTFMADIPSSEVCNANGMGNTTMCPQCHIRCPYWYLKSSCMYAKATYFFDNYATVAFSIFMSIWATLFLEFWKRKQRRIGFEWDVQDFQLEEKMRPEFEFKVKKTRLNPITNVNEPYMTGLGACCRSCTSMTIALFFILLVLAAILGVIIYRIVVVALIYTAPISAVSSWSKIITSITAACINLVIIMILGQIYKQVAMVLTELEMHRTETDFENAYTFKMFMFQFVNFYGSLFYIAFFKGRFMDHPGATRYYLFGKYQQDTCDPSGCMIDLVIQLIIIMIGKQVLNNAKELLLPCLMNLVKRKRSMKEEENLYMRWEQDKDMSPYDRMALFEEYLEMVIQFGFVTLFVAAFPLAPLFALLNNVVEVRLDAFKFVTQYRRPPANKAQDIGVWFGILKSLVYISIITNAFIIAWTSDFVPRLLYQFQPLEAGLPVRTLDGFVNFTMAQFNTADFTNGTAPNPNDPKVKAFGPAAVCSFRGFVNSYSVAPAYHFSMNHWLVLCARLAFVLVYEHLVFLISWVITYMVPDIPAEVQRLMLYEKQLNKALVFSKTFDDDDVMDTKQEFVGRTKKNDVINRARTKTSAVNAFIGHHDNNV